MANETVFKRYPNNPIVTAKNVPRANSIHNSAIVRYKNEFRGIFRVDEIDMKYTLHLGRSKDGINWDIEPQPINMKSSDPEVYVTKQSYDPRITQIEDNYYIVWCNSTKQGPALGLAYTKDFEEFIQLENPMPPCTRNGVLFPKKINGKYALLFRPSDKGHTPFGDIFYAESPDLIHWGHHRFVMGPIDVVWQSLKVGAGPAPIETKEGWLLIYHGCWQSCNGYLYYMGAALLDLEKPWRVMYRTKDYLLAPTEWYERVGDVPNVVFPSAAVLFEDGTLRVYYGCADTCVSMAEAKLQDVVDFIKKHSI